MRFSLRTMFVAITVLCCWLAWELSYVRERRTLLNDLRASRGFLILSASEWAQDEIVIAANRPVPSIPWVREWLGDEAIQSICFPPQRGPDEYERRLLQRVFPEAELNQAEFALMEIPPP